MDVRHAYTDTGLGTLLLVAERSENSGDNEHGEDSEYTEHSGDALVGVYFPEHWYPPEPDAIGEQVDAAADPFFDLVARQLGEYLAGERRVFDIPVRTRGDDFSEQVWRILRDIPYGETTSYGAIALRLGSRNFAQRVGQCVGHNPVSIVIPCHRVLGADGSLTGFAGGLERKRALLELEEPAEMRASRLF